MLSFSRIYAVGISFLSDILNSLPTNPSWGVVPKTVYKKAVSELKIESFSSNDQDAIIKTYDDMYFAAPKNQSEFLCGKRSLKRAKKYTKQTLSNIDISDAHAALINNLVNRYVTEFSAYPFKGIRTLNLRSGDTFVDIGAFRGYVSCKAAHKVGKSGKVLAVEPIQDNITYVNKHIKMNSLDNIELIDAALSLEEKDTIDFYRSENQQNSEIPDHIKSDAIKVTLNNISVKRLSNKILASNPNRVIVSLTTNGTELQLLGEFLTQMKGRLEYFEVIIPIIYTHSEAIEWCKQNQTPNTITDINYPWMSVISINPDN